MIDVDLVARHVSNAVRAWALEGVVAGLAEEGIAPIELPLLMGLMVGEGSVDSQVYRQWKLTRWIREVRAWILGRQLFKAGHVLITPGSRPVKVVPNWLGPHEQAAWRMARERAGLRIKGIEDNVRARLRHILADAIALQAPGGRRAMITLVTRRLQEEFPRIGKSWKMIARTELNAAFSNGVLTAVVAESVNALVMVIPSFDACEICKELYLDDDGEPRVWKVSRLIATGLGPPRHPNCRCQPKPVRPQRKSAA